mgnify:CR=1 FL=1
MPVALCEDIANVCTDPHLIERGMICRTPGPDGQDLTIPGFALRLGERRPHLRRVRADIAAALQPRRVLLLRAGRALRAEQLVLERRDARLENK